MSITETIIRACTQTVVYWGSPSPDGYGSNTFATAIEILCRWEDRTGTFVSNRGEQTYSKAHVYTLQDVDENGFLYLGELDDIADSSGDPVADPKIVEGAWEIKRFDKIPSLGSTTEFVRKAYL